MSATAEDHRRYRFGEFVLDLDRGALLREDQVVPLRPKSFHVLRVLTERAGVLVSKTELLDTVWPDSSISDDSLSQCLFEIRRALQDSGHRIVRTVPRRGVIFEPPVTPAAAETHSAGRDDPSGWRSPARRFARALILMLIVSAVGSWLFLIESGETDRVHSASGQVGRAAPLHSIAVLAFEDLSPRGEYRWFAEGLSEEVLNLLAQVSQLSVIARTSSFSFRGSDKDISAIAERLRVSHVLEGSVREDDGLLRITVQLVAAEDSSHLWSRTYDRALNDVFGVQSDIASAVAEALKLKLLDRQPQPVDHVPDPEAWSLYLRAHYLYNRRGAGDLARAAELYHQSVDRDPQLAAAWAGLAASYQVMLQEGKVSSADGMAVQREAARRALELAPGDATVLMRAARAAGMGGDRERMWALFYRALELEPDNPLVLGAQAGFALTRPERGIDAAESLRLSRRLARLDPMGAATQYGLGHALFRAGLLEEAEAQFRYVRELNPAGVEETGKLLALTQLLTGRPGEALSTAQSLPQEIERLFLEALAHFAAGDIDQSDQAILALSHYDDVVSAIRLAEIYSYRDEPEAALVWLGTARQRLKHPTPWRQDHFKILLATHEPLLLRHQDDPEFMARLEHVRSEMLAARDA